MTYFSTFLLSVFLSMALIPLFTRVANRVGAMDLPNERKVHARPIPRTGGLAIAAGAFVPALLWSPPCLLSRVVLTAGGAVVLFGFLDDARDLGYKVKFAAQAAAALLVILYGDVRIRSLGALLPSETELPFWASVLLTLVVILGVTNAINLADGLDGLAGGICAVSFACVAYLAYQAEDGATALLALAVAGATVGFLRFNTHPATVFMGDAGSQFLGFTAITLALALTQGEAPFSPLLPLLLLGFPVLDTIVVMGERLAEGRSPFSADKNHFHHKLLKVGLYHSDAVRAIYVLHLTFVAAAYALRFHSEWLLLGTYFGFCAVVLTGMAAAARRGWTLPEYGRFKQRLRTVRESGRLIRVSFRALLVAVPGILLFSCLMPGEVPRSYGFYAAALLGSAAAVAALVPRRRTGALRGSTYLLVPMVTDLAQRNAMVGPAGTRLALGYDLAFGALLLLSLLVVRFTRRSGFQSTPMDLLILFVACAVPLIMGREAALGMTAVRVLVLFFGFEVLVGELRGRVRWLWAVNGLALAIVVVRGLL